MLFFFEIIHEFGSIFLYIYKLKRVGVVFCRGDSGAMVLSPRSDKI